ncbi:serine/threonine protein kinase [Bacteroides sp. AN502(2024)]|uniref:serine/threonine protein kinase n=1 Tax=Bacteroides sp. AN502(2024) TaxID=3160599 RepID=UPI003513C772
MQQLHKNTLLKGGKYKIEKVLGQGGFGITYLASQHVVIEGSIGKIETDIKVAIKEFFMKEICYREEGNDVVTIPSIGSKQQVERFKQKFIKEAHNIAKLNHPHIIKVVDIFEANNTAYYVMEYHDKGSLGDYIKEKGTLSEDEALSYVLQIADALDYIHQQQMNHLDIKPDNILLNKEGKVVLIDFGLSKCYDANGEQTSTTPVGVSVGYAPLEQLRMGGVGTFSPTTDIYALGATLYKMLTGQTPPDASVVLNEGLPEMSGSISLKVQKAIAKAMDPVRKKRPQNITEFLNLFELVNLREKQHRVCNAFDATSGTSFSKEQNPFEVPLIANREETLLLHPFKKGFEEISFSLSSLGVQDLGTLTAVDLGLSVKWGSCNVGSLCTADKGPLYCWGDVSGEEMSESYYLDGRSFPDNIAGTEYDIVTHRFGKDWCLPTPDQWNELILCCNWEWVELPSISGYIITGSTRQKIFLPCAGRRYGCKTYFSENYGYYWSAMVDKSHKHQAVYCIIAKCGVDAYSTAPYYVGRSVRGVTSR